MKKLIATLFAALAFCGSAHAVTECTYNVGSVWTGDSGVVYVVPATAGPAFSAIATDANVGYYYSGAMRAMTLGTQIRVRFTATGVSCTTSGDRTDVVGIWNLP